MIHTLPLLPYPYDALEPHIDARTMELHHSRHHKTYIDNLNVALHGSPHASLPVDELVGRLLLLPVYLQGPVRNHGGGHANHSLFWSVMSPQGGGQPQGELACAISTDLGGFDAFKKAFMQAALGCFGSGWAWLCVNPGGQLVVESTSNQDSPLMTGVMSGNTPILGLDVWEHAYYLHYQNRRVDYITAFFNVIHWPEVARRYALARGGYMEVL